MSGIDEEEWVKAAMSDDTMVVELLVRLHRAAPTPPLKPPSLEWSVRQRRSSSRPVNPKKQAQRASPTTPLSWSGATSISGGSGGAVEESSRLQKHSNTTRSKVNGDGEKTASKRTRKKKTLAELKEEENKLLKERRDLKRELAALRLNLEKQRASNERLKRIKIEMQPLPDREATSVPEVSISGHLTTPPVIPPSESGNNGTLQPSTSDDVEQNADPALGSKFVLPDLNMPFEEDSLPDVICGVS